MAFKATCFQSEKHNLHKWSNGCLLSPMRAVDGVRKGTSSRLPLKVKLVKVSTGAFKHGGTRASEEQALRTARVFKGACIDEAARKGG
jgi:hypothetical protein